MDDRRPLQFEGRFLWHPVPEDESLDAQFDYLPRAVFDLLDGHIPRQNPRVDRFVKAYHTRGHAMAALHQAREQAKGGA